ncbi:MAG: GatB/YqeY domain-containing protein [Clostridia bacterium]|nr:GatB/YqeY domain-containing protein [Clostridia bacterium]
MKMKEELLKDLKQAMIDKDSIKKDTITMLRAAVLQIEKDEQKTLNDEDIIAVVAKEIKKRKEAALEYEKTQREDIIENLNKEIEILSKYLPEQLSNEEIKVLVQEAIESTSATSIKDMGKVMNILRPKISGRADGKVVSDIIKENLQNI